VIKFRTSGGEIKQVEVTKETAKFVTVVYEDLWRVGTDKTYERREAKVSDYYCYFDKWELAHEHLLKKAQDKCAGLRNQLERANGELGNIKGMKP
jgi:hypothetical protein